MHILSKQSYFSSKQTEGCEDEPMQTVDELIITFVNFPSSFAMYANIRITKLATSITFVSA